MSEVGQKGTCPERTDTCRWCGVENQIPGRPCQLCDRAHRSYAAVGPGPSQWAKVAYQAPGYAALMTLGVAGKAHLRVRGLEPQFLYASQGGIEDFTSIGHSMVEHV